MLLPLLPSLPPACGKNSFLMSQDKMPRFRCVPYFTNDRPVDSSPGSLLFSGSPNCQKAPLYKSAQLAMTDVGHSLGMVDAGERREIPRSGKSFANQKSSARSDGFRANG